MTTLVRTLRWPSAVMLLAVALAWFTPQAAAQGAAQAPGSKPRALIVWGDRKSVV